MNDRIKNISNIAEYMQGVGKAARAASRAIARASTATKNNALLAIAANIKAREAELLAANAKDGSSDTDTQGRRLNDRRAAASRSPR